VSIYAIAHCFYYEVANFLLGLVEIKEYSRIPSNTLFRQHMKKLWTFTMLKISVPTRILYILYRNLLGSCKEKNNNHLLNLKILHNYDCMIFKTFQFCPQKRKPLIELSENIGIVFKNKFQSSFRHSRISFFKKLQTKKSWRIKMSFISKKF